MSQWLSIIDAVCQFFIVILGFTAVFLVSRKIKWGFVVGLCAQPFWITLTIINHQWGILFSACVFVFIWGYGIYQWFFVKLPEK